MPLSPRLAFVGAFIFACASARSAEFPAPQNSGANHTRPAMTPAFALAAVTVPPGFRATVFAAEPDVQNPIAMAWDGRGRLWVAENYTYAEHGVRFDLKHRDRVLIFEETGSTGRFSSRRVFVDDVQRLTSVELGHGGVWLLAPPQLLFVPDRDGNGVPDGPAEVVLDGFNLVDTNYHTLANGLRFGPDGWLYGRCGASSPGELGRPGTPAAERVPLRGTMWRYQPVTKIVEVLSSGTTNPWGHDWDRHGELFFINTVNGHLWHGITGGHFARPHTFDPNPQVYALMRQTADHFHFQNSDARAWTLSRNGAANDLGGGHAHAGMMIYQGDNWPAEYRDALFTLNFHGRRVNQELLERRGSGYVGHHGSEKFLFGDPWFRGIEIGYGPDGGVFALDWSDMGECHNEGGVNRLSGRIYKIVHGEPKRSGPADLATLTPRELVALHAHANEWFVRRARVELASRAAAGRDVREAAAALREQFEKSGDVTQQLRALWTLHAIGAAEPAFLRPLLKHPDEHLRVWAIRLLTDRWPLDTVMSARPSRPEAADAQLLDEFVSLAGNDSSGLVRLTLASLLQRLPPRDRPPLAAALTARAEDAGDPNLPPLIWYGLIPVAETDPAALAGIANASAMPATRRFIVRRLTEDLASRPAALDSIFAAAAKGPASFQADVLDGMREGLAGTRKLARSAGWEAFAAALRSDLPPRARENVDAINVIFGVGRALDEVRNVAINTNHDISTRKAALQSLIDARAPDLAALCSRMIRTRGLAPTAATGLALFDTAEAADQLIGAYSAFLPSERPAFFAAAVSRPVFARALLRAIAAGRIPRAELPAFHARQIASLGDAGLTRELAQVWGEVRETPAAKREFTAQLKRELAPAALAAANKSAGRATFARLCATCHKLYGEGATLGPDLTGSGRNEIGYLLDNIVDPGAVVTADFRNTIVTLKDGRTLSGFVPRRTAQTITLRTMSDETTLNTGEIAKTETMNQSLMPEGMLESLSAAERRDLIAYLMHPTQVPLP